MSKEADNPGASNPSPPPAVENTSLEVSSTSYTPTTDDSYGYHDDPYAYESNTVPVVQGQAGAVAPPPPPPPPPPPIEEEDQEEEGMLRMSFLEHLEELRKRLLQTLMGIGVAFAVSLIFSNALWVIVSAPAIEALKQIGANPPKLVTTEPLETFSIVWVKLPLLCSIFLASPWVLWQVWSFIAPGLYKKERRWAAPFVIISAGLFIAGGCFAYFVAFRFGLVFLLGLGMDIDIAPMVSITAYFDLFVNVMLGIGLVFELPIIVFLLTLLRVASPRFLLQNSRYAILVIVLIAAIVTPTPDIFNLLIFAVPMVLLYFVGLFASYLLVLSREGKKFPWGKAMLIAAVILLAGAGGLWIAIAKYGFQLVRHWPFLVR